MKELRSSAYEAELKLSKAAAATWHAAIEYCECAHKVSNASYKHTDKNPNEGTRSTSDDDWDSYLSAMDVLSAAKDIAQETKVITGVDSK